MATGAVLSPSANATVTIAVTTTSGRVALPARTVQSMLITNFGTGLVFYRLGKDNTIVATTADVPILPGAVQVVSWGGDYTFIAAITASGTSALYATPAQVG